MRKILPPPHKFRPNTLNSTDTVDFTHFRRTVNRYCDFGRREKQTTFVVIGALRVKTMMKLEIVINL